MIAPHQIKRLPWTPRLSHSVRVLNLPAVTDVPLSRAYQTTLARRRRTRSRLQTFRCDEKAPELHLQNPMGLGDLRRRNGQAFPLPSVRQIRTCVTGLPANTNPQVLRRGARTRPCLVRDPDPTRRIETSS